MSGLEKYILLVGEGNFSFSAALSQTSNLEEIQKGHKLIATDLKPNPTVIADDLTLQNIQTIKSNNGLVFTDVDATKLENHQGLQIYRNQIDKVIFNFPHVQRKKMHIGANRELLQNFFKSVSGFIPSSRPNVSVVVTLCCGQSGVNAIEAKPREWADSWQIVEQAAYGDFVLTSVQGFNELDFYTNCGYRDRPNASFNSKDGNKFTFLRREQLLTEESLDLEPGTMKMFRNFGFLKTLSDSNPLLTMINLLEVSEEKLRLEIDDEAFEMPFFHLYLYDMDESITLKNIPFLIVETGTENICDDIDKEDKDKVEDGLIVSYDGINVGFVKENKISLNISRIVSIKSNIEDSRVLYSKYFNYVANGNMYTTTGSLYPCEHKWDISMWIIGDNFSYKKFLNCALEVYGLLLKSIKLLEEYKPCNSKKVSHCYRITIQSLDLGLSRLKANEFHVLFRKYLPNKLDVEMR